MLNKMKKVRLRLKQPWCERTLRLASLFLALFLLGLPALFGQVVINSKSTIFVSGDVKLLV